MWQIIWCPVIAQVNWKIMKIFVWLKDKNKIGSGAPKIKKKIFFILNGKKLKSKSSCNMSTDCWVTFAGSPFFHGGKFNMG